MKCKSCGLEMLIQKSRVVVENDDTPDRETKVYNEMDLACRNLQCPECGKFTTIRNTINIG